MILVERDPRMQQLCEARASRTITNHGMLDELHSAQPPPLAVGLTDHLYAFWFKAKHSTVKGYDQALEQLEAIQDKLIKDKVRSSLLAVLAVVVCCTGLHLLHCLDCSTTAPYLCCSSHHAYQLARPCILLHQLPCTSACCDSKLPYFGGT